MTSSVLTSILNCNYRCYVYYEVTWYSFIEASAHEVCYFGKYNTRLWLFAVVFDLGCLVKVSSVKAIVFDLESIFATTGTEWGMIFYCCLVIVTLHLFGGKHFPENVFIFWCLAWHKIFINRLFSAIHLCPYPPPFLSAASITTIGTTVTATIITTTPSCRYYLLLLPSF